MVSVILLAAGNSTRMGAQDKLLLKYKGHWLVNHVMQQLWASNIDELIIVRKNADSIAEGSGNIDASLLHGKSSDRIKLAINPLADLGMTTSIQAGVRAAHPNTFGYMICQADMPLILTEEYNKILDAFAAERAQRADCIAVPYFEGSKGNPVIISSTYKQAILDHQEMEGCRKIIKENFSKVVRVEMNSDHVLVDVDTVEDWERLKSKR